MSPTNANAAAPANLDARRNGRALRLALATLRRLALLAAVIVIVRMTGCMERLFYQPSAGPTPIPATLPGAESVWFNSADGTELHGWFIRAKHSTDARPPSILHVHGNAGNIESHIWFTEYLPAAGFNVFIFDYRGYGQSEGTARRRASLIQDTEAALDAMTARRDVDPARIGMYGQSLGGSIGLNVMASRPEIAAAVIESAFCSWRDEAACVAGGDPPSWFGRCAAWLLVGDSHRPDEAIARIERPILLVHGSADRIIPVSHSRRLKAAGGENVRLIEYPGGDHNTLRESHPRLEQDVTEFFRTNLAASRR